MAYDYRTERAKLFTEDGVKMLTKIRDNVKRLLAEAGAVASGAALRAVTGDSWTMLAALDYLVEQGEIKEVTPPETWGQHRVFVAA